jgi:hypothetical protein
MVETPSTPIQESFKELQVSTEELASAIAGLESRLAPITLLRGSGNTGENCPEPIRSEFNQSIVDECRKLHCLTQQVKNLTDSLEI